MKRFISPLTAALVVAIAVSVGVTGLAWAKQPTPAAAPWPSLGALSNRGLIDAFDDASGSNPDRATQIAQHLWQRRKEIPRSDLMSVIIDKDRSQVSRELMVDLLAGAPEEALVSDDVRDLLRDGRLNSALRARIVTGYEFGQEDSSLLSSLASGEEEQVAFHALKKLGAADPTAARKIALATLAESGDSSDLKLSASYKVLVRSGALTSDRATRNTVLRHLASVLADTGTSQDLQDSAAFALSDMQSFDALRMLLHSEAIDPVLLVGAVDQNAMTIKTALERDPDEATIELAVTAMEIYPVKEIAEPLGATRACVTSPELGRRLEAVLVHIARDGSHINTKWTED